MSAEIKRRVWEAVQAWSGPARELAQDILAHPEIGYRETRASRLLGQALAGEGFEVQQPFGGLDTAFCARTSPEGSPRIAFLAEYDALPEIGHGCGHNLIGPAAAAAAVGVSRVLDQVGGSLAVIGTPAEEYLGEEEGKVKLLRAGAFRGVDAALMLHPATERQVLGSDLGFIACELIFRGESAHAAADPWNGRNALDGLLSAFQNINALRQQLRPEVRVHGIITEGGRAPNIIPELTRAQFMVRAPHPDMLEEVYERVCDCAAAGAVASGTDLEVRRITTVYNTRINPTLNRLIENNFHELGETVTAPPLHMSASSDFGNVSQQLPAAMFLIDSHPEDIPWHSRRTAQASGEEKALAEMIRGACVLAGTAVDLLAEPELLGEAKKEFETHGQHA